uniref:RNase H type-1 domain-containing protein n=1 Tax=Davidia involucrata TaxID=16924 RepID=A0A5B7C5B3_DAVIN
MVIRKRCHNNVSNNGFYWGIREGLKVMLDITKSKAVVESDCISAISMLKDKTTARGEYDVLIQDCWLYALMFQTCIFSHTLREGNQCADHMANLGVKQVEMTILDLPPPGLAPLVLADSAAVKFARASC